MLKQRIITALIFAPLVLGSIYYLDTPAVAVILGLIILIGAWEWVGLSGFENIFVHLAYTIVTALILYLSFPLIGKPSLGVFLVSACFWWLLALISIFIAQARRRLPTQRKILFLFIGFIILVPAWLAVLYLHNNPKLGPLWVLFLLILIWTADIGAYFAGRVLGRHKLADTISPGKSWEGVFGGLVAVLLVSVLLLPYLTGTGINEIPMEMFLLCLGTAVISVLGDLTESVFKRIAGKKDSGNMLPGHGGIMDRIDSLTAAAPVFTMGLMLTGFIQ